MRAEVRSFEWPDLERGDHLTEVISTSLIFVAGPIGEQGGETFQVVVCTPVALTGLVEREGVVSGRHFLFVDAIDTYRIERFLRDRLRRIDGETWAELAEKIGRLAYWEFEDYVEARHS